MASMSFLRMLFGSKTAPRTFQRTIQRMLGSIKAVKISLDDILVTTETNEAYFNILCEVFSRLINNNVLQTFLKVSLLKQKLLV